MPAIGLSLRLPTAAKVGEAELTPPTVAPVLTGGADVGSNTAELSWTPSNKTGSDGFTYAIYEQLNGGGFSSVISTTDTFYNYLLGDGVYQFYIVPLNSAGEGPSSNTVEITLPGESEPAVTADTTLTTADNSEITADAA
jgi:hypothetical protein